MTQQPQARSLLPLLTVVLMSAGILLGGGCRRRDPKPAAPSGEGLPLQTFARQWATDLQLKGDALRGLHVREGAVYAYTTDGRAISLALDSGSIEFNRLIKNGATLLHPPVVMAEKVTFSIPRRRATAADRGQMPVRPPNQPPQPEEAPPRDEHVILPVIFPTATTMEIYEQRSGRFITANDMDFSVRSPAVGKAGMMYFGAAKRGSSRGVSIDVREHYVPVRWELMTPEGAVSAAPALWEDAVYFASEGGDVYAVTTSERESIWPLPGGVFKTGAAVVADLAVDNDCVYIASTDARLYALNRNSGKIRWQYYAPRALRAAPAVTSDTVYQYVRGTGLVAIDKASGDHSRKPRWVAQDATQFLAQDAQYAYVRGRDNRIVARDKKTGEVRFASQKREGKNEFTVFGTNLKEDGMVYAGTKAGRVVAVRPVLKPGSVGEVVMVDDATGE